MTTGEKVVIYSGVAILCFFIGMLLGSHFLNTLKGMHNHREEWLIIYSPDQNFSIRVDKGITFLSRPQAIRLYCRDEKLDESRVYLETEISNNGKDLSEDNYKIEWNSEGAILTFYGESQSPVGYIIKWDQVFQEYNWQLDYF